MNGSRLIAGCFRFIFGSRYTESTCSKFGVSAYSRINTVAKMQLRCIGYLWEMVTYEIRWTWGPLGSPLRRGLDTSSFWKRIYCMQFLSYNMCGSMLTVKVLCIGVCSTHRKQRDQPMKSDDSGKL